MLKLVEKNHPSIKSIGIVSSGIDLANILEVKVNVDADSLSQVDRLAAISRDAPDNSFRIDRREKIFSRDTAAERLARGVLKYSIREKVAGF